MDRAQAGRGVAVAEPVTPDEAARACLFSVVDRFNTEDPFWGSFVPETDSTKLGDGRFSLTLRGHGVRIEVQGVMLVDAARPSDIRPSIVVGVSDPEAAPAHGRRWHPVTCAVDVNGRFVTTNFRKAIELALADARR